MSFKNLSNQELMNRFGKLVQTERKITHLVLECIAEIDSRKIYLEKAYPSLYEFLVKEFGYSPSAAVRRIESARLLREAPQISEKIESGALNLSQLSKVQQAVRLVQKTKGRHLEVSEKSELLKKIEFTSQANTEKILAEALELPVVLEEKARMHRDDSVTLTITFNKKQIKSLENARDLLSHIAPEGKWADVITYLAEKEIERRTVIRRNTYLKKSDEAISKQAPVKSDASLKKSGTASKKINYSLPSSRPQFSRTALPPNLKRHILNTQSSCQFIDSVSGKTCGSKRFLQIDHIQPVWAGGDNSAENLRVLCGQHNRYKYAKESGLQPLRL